MSGDYGPCMCGDPLCPRCFPQNSTMYPGARGSVAEEAEKWIHSQGGRHAMKDLYALAATHVPRWKKTGIPIAVSLIWEVERQRIKEFTAWYQRRGRRLQKSYGYALNNSYRAEVARHIMARRPDWDWLFELRERKGEEVES